MATTPVEISLPSGETGLTLDLYPLNSTTADASGLSLTEETNALGFYRADVTGAVSGLKRGLVKDGGGGYFATTYVYLEDDTSVWREISQSEVGLWRESRPNTLRSGRVDSALTSGERDSIADAVWDEVITGAQHNVNASAAKFLREVSEAVAMVRGTAQSATSTTMVLASGDVTSDGIINHQQVSIVEGTGAGQARLVTDSVASTDEITVDRAWDVIPDSTSVYAIGGATVVLGRVTHVGATVPTVTTVNNVGDKTGYKLASDGLDQITLSEPGSVPTWSTVTLPEMIGYVGAFYRNKIEQDSSQQRLRDDADAANLATAPVSDDGTTYTRGEFS